MLNKYCKKLHQGIGQANIWISSMKEDYNGKGTGKALDMVIQVFFV